MFNTDYYNSRFFNKVVADGDTVVKSSSNIDKIKSEYQFYYYLPKNLKEFFVQPFSLIVGEDVAKYSMTKIPVPNSAQLILSGKLSEKEFSYLLDEIFRFKSLCPAIDKDSDAVMLEAWALVVTKTFTRLRDMPELFSLAQRLMLAYKDLSKNRSVWVSRVSHGDLCLSNILIADQKIKLIDPRGAMTSEDIYMDEYYDLAKLQHSLLSGYESMLYEYGEMPSYVAPLLKSKINDLGADADLLRVYEAGLFLSMVPLHAESKDRMDRFAKTAERILSTLGY